MIRGKAVCQVKTHWSNNKNMITAMAHSCASCASYYINAYIVACTQVLDYEKHKKFNNCAYSLFMDMAMDVNENDVNGE